MSVRKPHNDLIGYVSERRNKYSGDYTIIFDCKLAEKQGNSLVENYEEEGGRYQIACNKHGYIIHADGLPLARECMEDPTNLCQVCRAIAGECGPNWEKDAGLTDAEVAEVWTRRGPFMEKFTKPVPTPVE